MKEGGKEVVPPVTLKHCSNFYYEGSKLTKEDIRYLRRYLRTSKVSTYEGVKRCRSDLDHTTHTPLLSGVLNILNMGL